MASAQSGAYLFWSYPVETCVEHCVVVGACVCGMCTFALTSHYLPLVHPHGPVLQGKIYI